MKSVLATAGIVLAGCITIPEHQRDEIRYREAERINRFYDYRDSCARAGGILVIRTTGRLRRNGPPRHSDDYDCTRPVPAAG